MSIRVLQLGNSDFSEQYDLGSEVEWNYEPELTKADQEYDIAFLDRPLNDEEARILAVTVRAHCLFLMDDIELTQEMEFLMKSRCGRRLAREDLEGFLQNDLRNYFTTPYGEKFNAVSLTPSPEFHGQVRWNGFTEVILEGSFGETMQQAAFWRSNIPIDPGQALDFWLEYKKEGNVEIELQIVQFVRGSVSGIQNILTFSEEDLKEQVTVEGGPMGGYLFAMVNARGEGSLKLISLHDRYSRRGVGTFLPGCRRIVTSEREELFLYMDPGDLKPPMCVYFSGYKTLEGFEGYRMMRRMGCPFVLVGDARLEGGAFYLGSEEYETDLKDAIQDCLTELGFTKDQLVLSGLSMGTYGALYYGAMLCPKYTVIGKPLLDLGSMAEAERLERPGGFPTSLDVLWKQYHGLGREEITLLNDRLWNKFSHTDWSGRSFYAAYMIEDDYDQDAYQKLLSYIRGKGAKVIGKGLHGRHNDDTSGIVNWFLRQYYHILEEEYDRKQEA